MILVTETWLSKAIEEVPLEGYCIVSRRDQDENSERGGVLVLALQELADRVVMLEESAIAERLWVIVHTNHGPFMVAVWYRPPSPGEVASVQSLSEDLARLRAGVVGTVVCGDMNVHHRAWLRNSSGNTREGEALQKVCPENALQQIVREPTRGEYLLDLVLTDVGGARASTLASIADHRMVQVLLKFHVPKSESVKRDVCNYGKADWQRLEEEMQALDWSVMQNMRPDEAAQYMTQSILKHASDCIGRKSVCVQKSTHPWLNNRALSMVQEKVAAEGTSEERAAAERCSKVIMEEQKAWLDKTKQEMHCMRHGCKNWWAKSRQLLDLKTKVSSIPTLKAPDGKWIFCPREKADILAKTFESK